MAHTRGDVRRALGFGAAVAVLTTLACLAFASTRDARTISLAELALVDAVLMSCETGSASGGEPLWCADPSAPQCMPAAPDAPTHLVLAERTDFGLRVPAPPSLAHVYVLVPWPAPLAERSVAQVEQTRLERPPRA